MSVFEFFKVVKRSILHDESRCLTYFFSGLSFLLVCFIIIGTDCDFKLEWKRTYTISLDGLTHTIKKYSKSSKKLLFICEYKSVKFQMERPSYQKQRKHCLGSNIDKQGTHVPTHLKAMEKYKINSHITTNFRFFISFCMGCQSIWCRYEV